MWSILVYDGCLKFPSPIYEGNLSRSTFSARGQRRNFVRSTNVFSFSTIARRSLNLNSSLLEFLGASSFTHLLMRRSASDASLYAQLVNRLAEVGHILGLSWKSSGTRQAFDRRRWWNVRLPAAETPQKLKINKTTSQSVFILGRFAICSPLRCIHSLLVSHSLSMFLEFFLTVNQLKIDHRMKYVVAIKLEGDRNKTSNMRGEWTSQNF